MQRPVPVHPRHEKNPANLAGSSLVFVFAVVGLTLSGSFLLGEGLRQAIHRLAVINALNCGELARHAVEGAFIELAL